MEAPGPLPPLPMPQKGRGSELCRLRHELLARVAVEGGGDAFLAQRRCDAAGRRIVDRARIRPRRQLLKAADLVLPVGQVLAVHADRLFDAVEAVGDVRVEQRVAWLVE